MSPDFQQWKNSPLTPASSGEPQALSTLESIPSPPLHPGQEEAAVFKTCTTLFVHKAP